MTELKTLTAKATTTDRGEFATLAATWSIDRESDQIVRGAFAETSSMWQMSGKQIPLHWNHSSAPEDIVGTVDPSSLKETSDGLVVAGKLALEESEKAREVWRSVKAGAVSLSFGYLIKSEHTREDGIRELVELDLYEISLTPSPANSDTRKLCTKSVAPIQVASFEIR
jgi:HK97 family phage prohead protease